MAEDTNIQPMQSDFEQIKKVTEEGKEYWSARELATALGKLGSGTFREVENFHLSRLACLIIAENADNKKPQVQAARIYFKEQTSALELVENQNTSRILIYKTHQGESRVEVIFNSQTFWLTQKRMSDLYGVDVRTISYHLGEIFDSGELNPQAVIRKNWITAADGKVTAEEAKE